MRKAWGPRPSEGTENPQKDQGSIGNATNNQGGHVWVSVQNKQPVSEGGGEGDRETAPRKRRCSLTATAKDILGADSPPAHVCPAPCTHDKLASVPTGAQETVGMGVGDAGAHRALETTRPTRRLPT